MITEGEVRAENKIFDAIKQIFDAQPDGQPVEQEWLVDQLRTLGFGLGKILLTITSLCDYGRLDTGYIPSRKMFTLRDCTPITPEDSKKFVARMNALTAQLLEHARNMRRWREAGGER